jgi:uncharacterized BrkB/YihY/UPF0761 family membrane protein
MSNMTENQRAQFDRATYSGNEERIRRGSERGAAVYSVIALIVGILLCYAAVSIIVGWWQWLVLGAIIFTMVGFMIAISPNRRGA